MNKMLGGYFAGYSKFGGADAAKELLYDYMSNKIDGGGKKKIKKRVKKQALQNTSEPSQRIHNNEMSLVESPLHSERESATAGTASICVIAQSDPEPYRCC